MHGASLLRSFDVYYDNQITRTFIYKLLYELFSYVTGILYLLTRTYTCSPTPSPLRAHTYPYTPTLTLIYHMLSLAD